MHHNFCIEDSFLCACIQANEEIYHKLKAGYDDSDFVERDIGAGGDRSSGLDLYAESVFVKYLGGFGRIESEESGVIGEGDVTIIIDPIDGSSNALSLFPYYGTSIAKINAEGILDAAIVCNLVNGDLFLKQSAQDTLQGRLYSDEFREATVAPHPQIGLFEKAYENPQIVAHLGEANLKFRAPGAVALSLAYARTVRFMLFVGSYRIYDFAAGLALCEDLEVVVEEDYVIVSKDKNIVQEIEALVKRIIS